MSACNYFDQGVCTSCSLMASPYSTQLEAKKKKLSESIGFDVTSLIASPEIHFRTRAKMAVGFSNGEIEFGHWTKEQKFCAITHCPLHVPFIRETLLKVGALITKYQLAPYNVPKKKGDLKYVLFSTNKKQDQLQLRFVVRTEDSLSTLKKMAAEIQQSTSQVSSIWANIHPEHVASFEGDKDIWLCGEKFISENYNGLNAYYGPKSFFQTNPYIAEKLYGQVEQWLSTISKAEILDLFCGVGGFAFHAARAGHKVTGIEISNEAIEFAKMGAQNNKLDLHFESGDSLDFLNKRKQTFEAIIVNPPRRGLGQALVKQLISMRPSQLIYSSCNPQSFKQDGEWLKDNYHLVEVIAFDMFPHTEHLELLSLWRIKDGC